MLKVLFSLKNQLSLLCGNLTPHRFPYILLGLLLVLFIEFFSDKQAIASGCIPAAPFYQPGSISAGSAPWNLYKTPDQWQNCPVSFEYVPHISCCPTAEIGLRPYEMIAHYGELGAVFLLTMAIQSSCIFVVSCLFK